MFLIHVSGPQMSTEKHLFIAPSSIIGKSHHKVSKVGISVIRRILIH